MLTKFNKTIHKISDDKFIGDIKSVLGSKTITQKPNTLEHF
jgi:hypothetical protein